MEKKLRVASDELRAKASAPLRLCVSSSPFHSSFEFRISGFTFIEILFAVIILGIGFIMIAGVFPAAIQQTAAVSDETQGDAIVRDAIKKIQAVADAEVTGPNSTNTLFLPTLDPNGSPAVMAFSYNLTQAIGTDAFFTADHRFAWVGFYRRSSLTSPFAQVFVIALKNPNFSHYQTIYSPGETPPAITPTPPILPTVAPPIPLTYYNYATTPSGDGGPPVNAAQQAAPVPSLLTAYIFCDGNGNTYADFLGDPAASGATAPNPYAAPGAFMILADDNTSAANGGPYLNGRIFRLGNQVNVTLPSGVPQPPQTFYGPTFLVQPGYDISNGDFTVLSKLQPGGNQYAGVTGGPPPTSFKAGFVANVFVMGHAPTLAAGTTSEYTGPFTGPNQDIAAGSGFIRINTTNN